MSDEVETEGHKETKARSSKAFDLTKSIVTVVLASVAAAWISHHYKVEEENAAVYAESRKAATNTYYDIIDTIGKRHYYALRAAVGFQWHDDEMVHWQQYENMRAYWNEHRYSIMALTKRYFGAGTEQHLGISFRSLITSTTNWSRQKMLFEIRNLCLKILVRQMDY